jgi:hypothetical protein
MPADEDSIKVGQPEIYENADLQSRLDQLTDQLKSIKPIDSSSLVSALSGFQASTTTQAGLTLQILAPGSAQKPPDAGQALQTATPTALTLPSRGLLDQELQLSSQAIGYQLLLTGSEFARYTTSGGVKDRIVVGFPVTLNAGAAHRDQAAEVSVIYYAPNAGQFENPREFAERNPVSSLYDHETRLACGTKIFSPGDPNAQIACLEQERSPTIINILPTESSYNTIGISNKSETFGLGAVIGSVNAGASAMRGQQKQYLLAVQDTIAMQESGPHVCKSDALKSEDGIQCIPNSRGAAFKWQFRPVLGEHTVRGGRRWLFVQLAIPYARRPYPNYGGIVEIRTHWLPFNADRGLVQGPVIEEKGVVRAVFGHPFMGPILSDVSLKDLGGGSVLVSIKGDYLLGARVRAGSTVVKSHSASLEDTDSLNQVAAAKAGTNDKGGSTPTPQTGNKPAATTDAQKKSTTTAAADKASGDSVASSAGVKSDPTTPDGGSAQPTDPGNTTPTPAPVPPVTSPVKWVWSSYNSLQFEASARALALNGAVITASGGVDTPITATSLCKSADSYGECFRYPEDSVKDRFKIKQIRISPVSDTQSQIRIDLQNMLDLNGYTYHRYYRLHGDVVGTSDDRRPEATPQSLKDPALTRINSLPVLVSVAGNAYGFSDLPYQYSGPHYQDERPATEPKVISLVADRDALEKSPQLKILRLFGDPESDSIPVTLVTPKALSLTAVPKGGKSCDQVSEKCEYILSGAFADQALLSAPLGHPNKPNCVRNWNTELCDSGHTARRLSADSGTREVTFQFALADGITEVLAVGLPQPPKATPLKPATPPTPPAQTSPAQTSPAQTSPAQTPPPKAPPPKAPPAQTPPPPRIPPKTTHNAGSKGRGPSHPPGNLPTESPHV